MRFARRQIMLTVLGLALTAWLVDWMFGGAEPRPAGAAVSTGVPAGTTAATASGPASAKRDVPVAALIRRLTGGATGARSPLADMLLESDPFTPRGLLAERLAAPTAPPAPSAGGAGSEEAPPVAHSLQGVVLGKQPLAMIDGGLYAVGDLCGDYRVVAIERDAAELIGPAGQLRLRIRAAKR